MCVSKGIENHYKCFEDIEAANPSPRKFHKNMKVLKYLYFHISHRQNKGITQLISYFSCYRGPKSDIRGRKGGRSSTDLQR